MEDRVKFRIDLEAHKYDDVEGKDTVVLKDPASGKYFYLSSYEYRFLKTLDGNRTLEEAIKQLILSGYYYSLEEASAITGKAAQLGLVLGTKFGAAQFPNYEERKEIRFRPVGVLTFTAILCLLTAALVTPISRRSVYPCYIASAKVQKLTVPLETSVAEVFIREGTTASKGDLLFTLDSSLLRLRLAEKEIQRDMSKTELNYLLLDKKGMAKASEKEIELHKVEDEVSRITRDLNLAENGVVAPFDGVVTDLDYRLQTGFQPGEGVVVGEFESSSDCVVNALVPASDLPKVRKGQKAKTWLGIGRGLTLTGAVDEVKPYSEQDLRNLPFSSRFGGELATEMRSEDRTDVPLEAFYRCSMNFRNTDGRIPLGMTGRFIVDAPAQTLLSRLLEGVFKTFHKEAIF
jgi:putative peptide zinc metalloprotease protein